MKAEIIILCEDQSQNTFIRSFLSERGYGHRQMRTLPMAGSRGAGEQVVRKLLPPEIRTFRQRQNKALIVMTDADTGNVIARKAQLDKACQDAGVPLRNADEAIIFAIPTRNIETWFVYLAGQDPDEQTDHKSAKTTALAKDSGIELHRLCYEAQKLRAPAPPSLQDACAEWKRF